MMLTHLLAFADRHPRAVFWLAILSNIPLWVIVIQALRSALT